MDGTGGLGDSTGSSVGIDGTMLAVGGTMLGVGETMLAVGCGEDVAVGAEVGAAEQPETTNAAMRAATGPSFTWWASGTSHRAVGSTHNELRQR
jgi:hypothetical protein